jgi:hypothetical protein
MKTIKAIFRELFGLFVDDGNLALAILALLAVVALLVQVAWVDMNQAAVVLVAGNIVVLIESIVRKKAHG